MSKKWLEHVKSVLKENPGKSLETSLQIAETTFFSKSKKNVKKKSKIKN